MSVKEKIVINKEDYYALIDYIKELRGEWQELSDYVDLKIEFNPSNKQYKNVKREMNHIKGVVIE